MNFFCRIFGHTWSPAISAPEPRWNTTKDMHILAPSTGEVVVRHFDKCMRCAEERELPGRALDSDQPHKEVLMDSKSGEAQADQEDEAESA